MKRIRKLCAYGLTLSLALSVIVSPAEASAAGITADGEVSAGAPVYKIWTETDGGDSSILPESEYKAAELSPADDDPVFGTLPESSPADAEGRRPGDSAGNADPGTGGSDIAFEKETGRGASGDN